MLLAHYSALEEIKLGFPLVLAIGVFDGLHLGHRELFRVLLKQAEINKSKSAIWTFDSKIPKPSFTRLMNEHDYLSGLGELGVEEVHKMDFIDEVSHMDAETFLIEVLVKKLGVLSVVLGADARLGKDRRTSASEFKKIAQKHQVEVHLIPLLKDEKGIVSSSRIRKAISKGDFPEASSLLGRPFSMSGEVEKGRQLGRTIGFPTSNIACEGLTCPPKGVYRCEVKVALQEEAWLPAMSYIGNRPTVNQGKSQLILETHIPNWSGDLYGKRILVSNFEKIRDEKTFSNIEELKQQIKKDLAFI